MENNFEINRVYNENNLETMARMPSNFVDLIVTSPPYNKAYWSRNRNANNGFGTKSRRIEYENYSDCLDQKEYDDWQRKVISECLRILKPSGSLFYNHQPIQHDHLEVNPMFVYDFPIKQTIVWNRQNTPKLDKSYFFPVIEYVYWIKKSSDSRVKFNRRNADFNSCVWNIPPESSNAFPAPFPFALASNCVSCCTDEADLVYDPFCGSGTTALAAIDKNRNWVGSEISEEYCKLINRRVSEFSAQMRLL